MNEKINFRVFEEKDIPSGLDVIREGLSEEDAKIAANEYLISEELMYFVRYVVEIDNKIIGTGGYYTPHKEDSETSYWDNYMYTHYKDNSVSLDWFVVLPEFRNRGIGTKLLNFLEQCAREQKKKYFFTWTIAPDFFKKNGYVKAVGYNESDDDLYHCILMIKEL